MKLYFASFLEPENFGPGRLIGIVDTKKPYTLQVNWKYPQFTPTTALKEAYVRDKETNYHEAKFAFVKGFDDQLKIFFDELKEDAKKEGKDPKDLLPFQDGDTFCSWERKDRHNYRGIISGYLKDLGYEISLC